MIFFKNIILSSTMFVFSNYEVSNLQKAEVPALSNQKSENYSKFKGHNLEISI